MSNQVILDDYITKHQHFLRMPPMLDVTFKKSHKGRGTRNFFLEPTLDKESS